VSVVENYVPPGPVAAAFIASTQPTVGLMGPVGSGKTNAFIRKLLVNAGRQAPGPGGVRRRRVGVYRNTYRQLEDSTLKSWHEALPPHLGRWRQQELAHTILFDLPDGTKAELEVLFRAADRPEHLGALKGTEYSDVWLNEAVEFPFDIAMAIGGRFNRYPRGGVTFPQLLMDTNAPDVDSWWYQRFEEERPEGWRLYRQPGGLEPAAENLDWINQTAETLALPLGHPRRREQGRGYYRTLLPGKAEWWVRVMIHNQYAYSVAGRPVYPEYVDAVHCAPAPLEPIDAPIAIGVDAGLWPAAIVAQRTSHGQWRWTDEILPPDHGCGVAEFGERVVEVLARRYRGLPVAGTWADPTAASRAPEAEDAASWLDGFARATRLAVRPAPTNRITPRLEAVRRPLTRPVTIGPGEQAPGLLVCPTLRRTRKGFAGAYRFKAVHAPGGTVRYEGEPEKNEFSHPHDAGQYLMLGASGYADVMGRGKARAASGQTTVVPLDFDLF
jgi:hypothetical protein